MSALRLISHELCPYVQRAVITLTEKNIAHERVYVDLANKPDWFRALSPLGKTPVLEVNGTALFESAVIIEFLDETTTPRLHPDDPLERAKHRAWIEFASSLLNDIGGLYNAPDGANFARKRADLVTKFDRLEGTLDEGPYFAGDAFRLVDVAYGPVFRYFDVFDQIADWGMFATTPRVRDYRAALAARASVQSAVRSDYAARLMEFLRARGSHLSALMR